MSDKIYKAHFKNNKVIIDRIINPEDKFRINSEESGKNYYTGCVNITNKDFKSIIMNSEYIKNIEIIDNETGISEVKYTKYYCMISGVNPIPIYETPNIFDRIFNIKTVDFYTFESFKYEWVSKNESYITTKVINNPIKDTMVTEING